MTETRLHHESAGHQRSELAPLARIVVATDFSQSARCALDRAQLLPLARGATIELLHVRKPGAESGPGPEQALAQLVAELAADPRGLRVVPRVCEGEVYVEIIRAARRIDAELVVVGRHGKRTLKERWLGSTVSRVVRKGDVPVLIVNALPQHAYRRPIVAVDLEDAARKTIATCLRVLGPEAHEVELVHALHVPFEGLVAPVKAEATDYHHAFTPQAEARLDQLIASFAATGVPMKRTLRSGDVCTVLYESMLAPGTDLLAIGTHGRTGLVHVMHGSIADSILDIATCDVLVARAVRFSFEGG
jgi:nucleotide-binding universal stress UspA family protein